MIKIAVVSGGYSDEYVISLKSGAFIFDHLSDELYQKYRVQIVQEGWFVLMGNEKFPIDKSDFSFTQNGEKIRFDVAYNTIHGTPGEDGHMQAYFELIGLPYTGARFYPSALTFNKRDSLSVLEKFGIKKAKSIYVSKGEPIDFHIVEEGLGLPIFVKPNQSGSSLGVSKVYAEKDFQAALENAFQEDDQILIESEIKGDEVSIGVVSVEGKGKAVGSTQIISDNDFFDYQAKYHGESKEITPANIPYETEKKVMQTAETIYDLLGLTGIARLDFILQNEEPYFLEANTNPGLSPQSIFPQQVQAGNYNFSEMLDHEIQLAFQLTPLWNQE